MKSFWTAITLSIALPAVAHAQAAPAAKMDCCEKMKEKCDCCKGMAKMDHGKQGMKAGADPHAGHDMTKPSAPAPAPAEILKINQN